MNDFNERVANLSAEKRAHLEAHLKSGEDIAELAGARAIRSAPLSFAQQRLWFLDQLEPGNPFYNMPGAFRIRGALDIPALERSLTEIVRRHEVLRTTYAMLDNAPVQIVHGTGDFALAVVDLASAPPCGREAEALRLAHAAAAMPFSLSSGPVWRAHLVRLTADDHLLTITLHHIASDNLSKVNLYRELGALYQAFASGGEPPLSEPPIQYADYAIWQRERLKDTLLDEQLGYWKQQLDGAPPLLELPTDYPRPQIQKYHGAHQTHVLARSLLDDLKALSHANGATLFMTLLAAFKILLARYTRSEDILVGTPVAGRVRVETENLIGFFANTLVLRTDCSNDPSFTELLARVRETCLQAYAHQDLPFEKLVEELKPDRNLGYAPLIQVMFGQRLEDARKLSLRGLEVTLTELQGESAMFDLYMGATDTADGLHLSIEYCTDLFDQTTITRLIDRYQTTLEGITANPDQRLSALPMLTAGATNQLSAIRIDTAAGSQREVAPPWPPVPLRTQGPNAEASAPLSYHQERLWFIDQFETGNVYEASPTYHNIPLILCLSGSVESRALEASLNLVIARHEALRTRIVTVGGEGRQVLSPHEQLRLKVVELADSTAPASAEWVIERALAEASEPFVLDSDLLIRATHFRLGGDEAVLALTLHHLITDKRSLHLLAEELGADYAARLAGQGTELPALALQYADYAKWQLGSSAAQLELLLFYWRWQLRGRLAALELPTDRARPAVHTYTVARLSVSVKEDVARQLARLGAATGTDLFTVVLAGFKALLHRYARQDEIVVGTSMCGRHLPGIQSVIGPFANLVVLRSDLSGNPMFRALLGHVTKTVEQAREHQEMPFDKLVQELKPDKDMSRTALFDVLFELEEGEEAPSVAFGARQARMIDTNLGYGKYDLNLALRGGADGLAGTVVYNADLFDAATVARMMRHFAALLAAVAADAERRIDDITLLSAAEEQQQLETWSVTAAMYPQDKTIHQLFKAQVTRTPHNTAVICGEKRLTYGELDERSNRLARYLRGRGVAPETLVAVCLDRSTEMVEALLAVLKAGGAYLPLDPAYPPERLRFMVDDSGVAHLLTTEALRSRFPVTVPTMILLDTDGAAIAGQPATPPPQHAAPDNLAYVIYTSGSTGQPKGVLLEHRNVVRLMVNAQLRFTFTADDVWTMFHSYCFDFSVWEMYGALLHGGTLVVVVEDVAKDSALFLELLREQQVTVLNQTPSAFDSLAREALRGAEGGEGAAELALRYVIFGGETLQPVQLREWRQAYPAVKLVNMYGITETTVHVTFKEVTEREISTNVNNIGRPLPATTTYVMDERLRLLPVGVVGEVCVGGGGVSRGYLGREELTRQKFVTNPYRAGERLYRSGDLAKLLPDGEMVYLGRLDEQVQIRGFRVELGEVRSRLLEHPLVSQAEVVARKIPGEALELVAYVAQADVSVTALRDHLARTLPYYMTPTAFVLLKKLPLTANGKVNRRALPEPDEARHDLETSYVAPRTGVEEVLVGIWAEVLRVRRVGVKDNFFDLGGHSLLATQVISRVRSVFHIELPLRTLFEAPTVAVLSLAIAKRPGLAESAQIVISRRATNQPLPLSFAQQRLWFLQEYERDSVTYNTTRIFRLTGPLNVESLRQAFAFVISRHEILRTSFAVVDEEPVQVIHAADEFRLALIDLTDLPENLWHAEARRLAKAEAGIPFDLSAGPLIRISLLRLSPNEHALLITHHHIVFDGWSDAILYRDLSTSYQAYAEGEAPVLPELPIQYADYAIWQRGYLPGKVLDKELVYWKDKLQNASPLLALPTDRPRPQSQSFKGAHQQRLLERSLLTGLKALSQSNSATLFMTLLAAFKVLLSRYTRAEDIIVGSPIAGRTRTETENLIGFFINTLVLRTDLSGDPGFRELLTRVRETALSAYAHQDLPFEKLVEELNPERSLSYSPLFQVMFALQNVDAAPLKLAGLTIARIELDMASAKFDLSIALTETKAGLHFSVEYNTDLFDQATIARLIGHYETLLQGVVVNPQAHISELPLLREAERDQLLVEWSNGPSITDGKVKDEIRDSRAQRFDSVKRSISPITPRDEPLFASLIVDSHWSSFPLSYEGSFAFYRHRAGYAPMKFYDGRLLATFYSRNGKYFVLRPLGSWNAATMVALANHLFALSSRPVTFLKLYYDQFAELSSVPGFGPIQRSNNLQDIEDDSYAPLVVPVEGLVQAVEHLAGVAMGSFPKLAYLRRALRAFEKQYGGSVALRSLEANNARDAEYVIRSWAKDFRRRYQCKQFALPDDDRSDLIFSESDDFLIRPYQCLLESCINNTSDNFGSVAYIADQPVGFLFLSRTSEKCAALYANLALTKYRGLAYYLLFEAVKELSVRDIPYLNLGGQETNTLRRFYLRFNPFALEESRYRCFGTRYSAYVTDLNSRRRLKADDRKDQLIHELFEAQVERTPDSVAVIFEDETLSYAQLNRKANQLAHQLRSLGVAPETLVGLFLARSSDMIVALMAIFKAGGAYLPLDPAYPKERLAFMLKDAWIAVVVTSSKLAEDLPETSARRVLLDEEQDSRYPETNPKPNVGADNLAYVIYTSGSTGQPKGVMITHRAIAAHTQVMQRHYDLSESDRVLQFSSPNFDVSLERLTALISGAGLVVRGTEIWSPGDFCEQALRFGLTVAHLPTVYWQQLVDEWTRDPGLARAGRLRLLTAGGEAMQVEALRRWLQTPLSNIRLLNCYGPTETTITATFFEVPRDRSKSFFRVPIGRPVANAEVYILDPHLAPVPIGVLGELHIGGDRVARGYLNHPELTAEKFIPNPFSEDPGSRLYKTGDLARYLADGNIEFIGRVDTQVKIRGFRIELGEIEAALMQHRAVGEAVVIAREDARGDKRLVAYVVNREDVPPSELRSFLKGKLPEYMLPSAIVVLDRLPISPNGKLDRKALPAPEYRSEEAFVSPRTPNEETLAAIWAEVLKLEKIGIHDNFFDLGGHSLFATQVIARVNKTLNVDIPLRALFESPTVVGLSALIVQSQAEALSDDELAQFLAEAQEQGLAAIDRERKGVEAEDHHRHWANE